LYNVNQTLSSYQNKTNALTGSTQMLNAQYAAIRQEANNAGIDITDYNIFEDDKQSTVDSYTQILLSQGVDPITAKQKAKTFENIYGNQIQKGRKEF
jgi:hypothetical protein